MNKLVLSLCLCLGLMVGLGNSARAASVQLTATPQQPTSAVVRVADAPPPEAASDAFRIDPPRLLFFGAGLLTGLAYISPALEVSEIFGAVLGVVGAEYLYQTIYKKAESSFHGS